MKTITKICIILTGLSGFFLATASLGQSHGSQYIEGYCAKLEKDPSNTTLMDSIYTVSEGLTNPNEILALETCVCNHGTKAFCDSLKEIKRTALESENAANALRLAQESEAKKAAAEALRLKQEADTEAEYLRKNLEESRALALASSDEDLESDYAWLTARNVGIFCGVVVLAVCGAWYFGIGPFATAAAAHVGQIGTTQGGSDTLDPLGIIHYMTQALKDLKFKISYDQMYKLSRDNQLKVVDYAQYLINKKHG